jgi:transcriptional regulator with XRE-family HTH domain
MGNAVDEITPFLKARRAALDPAALGLPTGVARRRVHGLRREEVAQLAGISVDYYTRIEQGRAHSVSREVLDAVARALHLTPPEHDYLRNITQPRRRGAGASRPAAGSNRPRVRPQILDLLETMGDTVPAVVYGPGTDILAWNRAAARLSFDFDALSEPELNAAHLIFCHPDAKALYPDWEEIAEESVAALRAELGRNPDEPRVHQVMCGLSSASEEFRRTWEAREVLDRAYGTKRVRNPEVGELVLTFETFPVADGGGQRLCTYTAPKGSVTELRLQALTAREGASSL